MMDEYRKGWALRYLREARAELEAARKIPYMAPSLVVESIRKARNAISFLGMAGVLGYFLFHVTTYSGPGGFAEAVTMALVLSPMTIPFTVGLGAVGALVGFALASGLLDLRRGRVSGEDQ